MNDDTLDDKDQTKVSRKYDTIFPTIHYDIDDGYKAYVMEGDIKKYIHTSKASSANSPTSQINDKFEEKDLTDKQRLCYHKFELVGKSPVLDEEWWNCKECGIAREDYEAHRKRQNIKRKYNEPSGEIWF